MSLVRAEYDGDGGVFWRPKEMIPSGDYGRSWRPKSSSGHQVSTIEGRGWRPVISSQASAASSAGRSWRPKEVSANLNEGTGRYWRPKQGGSADKFLATEKSK